MISAVCRLSLRLCVRALDWTCVSACCMCVHCINRLVLTIAAKSLRSMLPSIALPGAICPATSLPHTCSPSSSFLPSSSSFSSSQLLGYRVKCIRPLLTHMDGLAKNDGSHFILAFTRSQRITRRRTSCWQIEQVMLRKAVCVTCTLSQCGIDIVHTHTLWFHCFPCFFMLSTGNSFLAIYTAYLNHSNKQ